MHLNGAGYRGEGNAWQGAMHLLRSRCRRLGESCAPFVIPAQAGIQRGSGGRGDFPTRGIHVTSLRRDPRRVVTWTTRHSGANAEGPGLPPPRE